MTRISVKDVAVQSKKIHANPAKYMINTRLTKKNPLRKRCLKRGSGLLNRKYYCSGVITSSTSGKSMPKFLR